jgi:hypothetical protein
MGQFHCGIRHERTGYSDRESSMPTINYSKFFRVKTKLISESCFTQTGCHQARLA